MKRQSGQLWSFPLSDLFDALNVIIGKSLEEEEGAYIEDFELDINGDPGSGREPGADRVGMAFFQVWCQSCFDEEPL